MTAKRIQVTTPQGDRTYRTTANTIGELFNDSDFRANFNIPSGAVPTVNGERVGGETPLTDGMDNVSYQTPASDKG